MLKETEMQALKDLNYTGSANDMLSKFLEDQQCYGQLDDAMSKWLVDSGYHGSLTDMMDQWRTDGGSFSTGVTPGQLVNTDSGAAYLIKSTTGNTDTTNFWASMVLDNVSTANQYIYQINNRTHIRTAFNLLYFRIYNTSQSDLVRGSIALTTEINSGNPFHVYLEFDGAAGTFQLWVDGVDRTADCSFNTAAQTGTVDHTNGNAAVCIRPSLGSPYLGNIADFMVSNNTPPGISNVYDGGLVPVDSIDVGSEGILITGDASVWNGPPSGLTLTGTFLDA